MNTHRTPHGLRAGRLHFGHSTLLVLAAAHGFAGQCVRTAFGTRWNADPGSFEAGHSDEEKGKLAAVHFVRFRFLPPAIEAFRRSDVDLVVDHPATRARTRLSAETKAELLTDLAP